MSAAFNGQAGNVFVGTFGGNTPGSGTDMDVDKWTADIEVNAIEVSTTADGGWHDEIGGLKKVSGTFEFFYNTAKKPTSGSIGMTPGSFVFLTLQLESGETLSGNAFVQKLAIASQVNGATKVVASYTNKGPWVLPS